MKFLMDTNVISETLKPEPDRKAMKWLREQSMSNLHLSVFTIGEILKGVKLKADGSRKTLLQHWIEIEIPEKFKGRIIPIDIKVMEAWSTIIAENSKTGRSLPVVDSLIAATAIAYNLKLITRNVKDFDGIVDYINPFA
ncbi:MAG: type II toxin-antitoxin system VapC family toxin [Gammaproteobacteria bacterium]|nr:type II toxin-antitoxin system VapC family toxin [Gammaproteobacteria bacterium]